MGRLMGEVNAYAMTNSCMYPFTHDQGDEAYLVEVKVYWWNLLISQ